MLRNRCVKSWLGEARAARYEFYGYFFEMTKIGILMLCSLEASFLKVLLYLWSSIAYFRVHTWSSNLSYFEEHYPVANVNSNATSIQGRRKVWQPSWASSNVVGIICPLPPVWDWVNWFTKYRVEAWLLWSPRLRQPWIVLRFLLEHFFWITTLKDIFRLLMISHKVLEMNF